MRRSAFGWLATPWMAGDVPCYRIETPTATYCLEKVGAGLSSMVDAYGNAWIGFHKLILRAEGEGCAGVVAGEG